MNMDVQQHSAIQATATDLVRITGGGGTVGTEAVVAAIPGTPGTGTWTARYGARHQMRRIVAWPPGIAPPQKVRVYFRNGRFLLQWWEPKLKKNVSEPVDGDLVAAVYRAREINQKLLDQRSSGHAAAGRRLTHDQLVKRYLDDLERRSDAGEVEPASVRRFASALDHYRAFARQMEIHQRVSFVRMADRQFALDFAAFLRSRQVRPNGREASRPRPMKGQSFVWDAARAMYEWAADPDRGRLLPEGFRNPFRRSGRLRSVARDMFGEPDITLNMAIDLIGACDRYQLRLFAPMILYGLRAAEPAFLFHEYLQVDWLLVPCNDKLFYTSKGKRDKRLPLIEPVRQLLAQDGRSHGLLYQRRGVAAGSERALLSSATLDELAAEIERRALAMGTASAAEKQRLRDQVLDEAGALDYDRIQGEFKTLAAALQWPRAATLKDLRHLWLTLLSNAGMPEPYRQYLAGQAQASAPVSSYTHLNQVREQYERALDREFPALLSAIKSRLRSMDTAGGA